MKDTVVITKKKSTNGVYNPIAPVCEGFKLKATHVALSENLIAGDLGIGNILVTSPVKKVKVNKEKFIVKVHTLNSVYKLKFKAQEQSELFKKFM